MLEALLKTFVYALGLVTVHVHFKYSSEKIILTVVYAIKEIVIKPEIIAISLIAYITVRIIFLI